MDLIYFSPVPWNSIAQRPHFFIKEAIKQGFDNIIWVNPTPSRFPELYDLRRVLSPFEASSFDIPPQVKVISPRLIPIEPFNSGYKLLNKSKLDIIVAEIKSEIKHESRHIVVGKPCLLAEKVLAEIDFTSTALDMMDDFPCFFSGLSRVSVGKTLERMIQQVDLCIYSSTSLGEKYSLTNLNSMLVLNACDEHFLQKAQSRKRNPRTEKLIFGYVGTVATWFDWDVVLKLSSQYPESEIHIVGPNYSSTPSALPTNVTLFPAIEHSKVSEVIATFDYGLIPFKQNELTESVDPVKYYEYLAHQIPVISTPFGQMKYRIENNNVHDFSVFSVNYQIEPESTVTWHNRFRPFFNLLKQ
ncbi:glycosyltransferase [Photobacterium lipolyticum]|uniref:Glycosyltransferase n=1 Tax=Photobacterium lipolyticum TaxID=266810 RepID=A0A2T3MVC7_9GAMM|nr:glycosyltransferase [Photobacterium lipolyticum]PSW03902.1 glycosyltransferase [Photobacterium lipolyticum]